MVDVWWFCVLRDLWQTKQSKDYDLQGDYVRHWLPELANVPASRIHEPWLMSKEEQEKYVRGPWHTGGPLACQHDLLLGYILWAGLCRYGVRIGVDYPEPISTSRYGRPHSDTAFGESCLPDTWSD